MEYPEAESLDKTQILHRFAGREELLADLCSILLETGPPLISKIDGALARQDPREIEYAAHTLKTSVGTFGAWSCFGAARQLEKMAASGQLTDAGRVFSDLQTEFQKLMDILGALSKERT